MVKNIFKKNVSRTIKTSILAALLTNAIVAQNKPIQFNRFSSSNGLSFSSIPDGILKVFRPILDLHLSYVNQEEKILFDSITSSDPGKGLLPYTPHTTGKAGIYYPQRLQENITPMTGP